MIRACMLEIVLHRAILRLVPEPPSATAISLPSSAGGAAPRLGRASAQVAFRTANPAELGPVYQHDRPVATHPARPERMRGHQGPESVHA